MMPTRLIDFSFVQTRDGGGQSIRVILGVRINQSDAFFGEASRRLGVVSNTGKKDHDANPSEVEPIPTCVKWQN